MHHQAAKRRSGKNFPTVEGQRQQGQRKSPCIISTPERERLVSEEGQRLEKSCGSSPGKTYGGRAWLILEEKPI